MDKQRILSCLVALLLVACGNDPGQITPALTQSPSSTPSQIGRSNFIPIITSTPTPTPSPTATSEYHLKMGDQAFSYGDYSLALEEYKSALSSAINQDTYINALWGLGRVEYAIGNTGKALIDLGYLANTYQDSPFAARANFLMGEIFMTLERYSEAAEAYRAYIDLRPGILDNFVLERCGDAYNSAGNYPEALVAYKTALSAPHRGDDTDLQIKIAQAYVSSGDIDTALALYESIYQTTSNDYIKAQTDLLTGRLYLSLGQIDMGYQYFLDAVNNYWMSYDSYSSLVTLVNAEVPVDDLKRGLTDYYAGQFGYALDAFQRYINANPDNDGTAQYFHAMALLKLGEYQQGVDELTYFIINFPDNQNWQAAWGEKAETQWSELGDYAAAAQTYLDYSKADPNIMFAPQAILNAGRNYERANYLDDAAATWESVAESYPGSDLVPQALFFAGVTRFRSLQYDQALLTFQRALQFSSEIGDQARASFWIGKSEQALGDIDAARSSWQQASSLDPTDFYSLRAQDMLLKRPAFDPPPATNSLVDLAAERAEAEAWLRVTFNLPTETDLSASSSLLLDPRLVRGTELWKLGLSDEALLEFEELRLAIQENPADSFRLANYLLDLGLYRPAIMGIRQVLTLAGMINQSQTLAAPAYFNHVRYGMYFQDLVDTASHQVVLDPLLLFSTMRQESLFEGFVQSSSGARGLMQITPDTGQFISENLGWPPDYTSNDLYRPMVSIILGATYLKNQSLRFDGELITALAAYNAGPEAAQIWRDLSGADADLFVEIVRYEETRNYLRSIYEIYSMYRSLYGTVP